MTIPRSSPGSEHTLLDLATRCEKATGPDQELDRLIWAAVFAPAGAYVERSRFNGEWCIYAGVDRKGDPRLWEWRGREKAPQPVTNSIDAAMLLGEPGAEISISTLYGVARVEYPLNFADHAPHYAEHVGGLIAPAICAAMLRARASKKGHST